MQENLPSKEKVITIIILESMMSVIIVVKHLDQSLLPLDYAETLQRHSRLKDL